MTSTRIPLAKLLQRGHWRVAMVAVVLLGLMSSVGSLLVLRTEVERSLELVARAAAYSTEAAVVFRDSEAAQELLAGLYAVSCGTRGIQLTAAAGLNG